MTISLNDLTADIRHKAGDSVGTLWSDDEILAYIQQGYNELTAETGLLFETALFPDVPFAFNYTSPFEADYITTSQWGLNGPAQFTTLDERYYAQDADGPATHNEIWEGDYDPTTEVSALINVPLDMHQIERSTWNTKKIVPLHSREMEVDDGRYELNKGEVIAYTQDKDGLGRVRKWRVPSAAYIPVCTDDFGIVEVLGDL